METWSRPRALPEGWFAPSIAFDGAGRAVAAYTQVLSTSPVATRVAVADMRAADEWVDGFEINSTEGDIPYEITLGVGANGTAAACVTSRTSMEATAKMRHRVVYRPAGGRTWEDPVEIVAGSEIVASDVGVHVAPNGLAVVVAARADGPQGDSQVGSVFVSAHPANGTWTIPQQVSTPGKHASSARLGLDAQGNATIAWVHQLNPPPASRSSIRVVTRDAGSGSLSAPVAVTAETGLGGFWALRLDVNPSGAAALAAQGSVPGNFSSQVEVTVRATAAGAWQPITSLFDDSTAASSNPSAVGISDDGTGYVMFWRQGPVTSDNDVIGMSRCVPGGTWEPPRDLSVTNMNLFDGAIAVRGNDAHLVYTGAIGFAPGAGEQGIGVFQASVWRAGATPDTPVDLAPQGSRHFMSQATADNKGSVVVTETVFSETTSRTFVTTLDRVLPTRSTIVQQQPVTGVAFSPDSARLAIAAGPTVRVVELATGLPVREVSHGATVNAVEFRTDGLSVATCGDDGNGRLTEIGSGNELARIDHGGPVVAVAVSRNGQRLVTAGQDATARAVKIGDAVVRTFSHDEPVTSLAVNTDGTRVATGCEDGNARIFDADSGLERFRFGQGGAVDGVAFGPDGSRLATAGADGTARLYVPAAGTPPFTIAHEGPVHAVAFDRDGGRLATASGDGTCRIITAQTGAVSLTLRHPTALTAVAWSPDGTRLATVSSEDVVYVYDATGALLARLRHPGLVAMITFAPDGSLLATACHDKLARTFVVDGA